MRTQQSQLKKRINKRGLNANENALGNQRKSWSLATILSILLKKRKSVTLVRSRVLTAIRKTTMLVTAPSQKTSISLSNLHAGN